MTRDELTKELTARNWVLDKWGHFKKAMNVTDKKTGGKVAKHYRIKMQANSCRLEVQITHGATAYSPAKNEWIRVGGGYYGRECFLHPDRTLQIGTTIFRKPVEKVS